MLNPSAADDVLGALFRYVEEHMGEDTDPRSPVTRLTIMAVAHNRSLERCRTGGKASKGEGLAEDDAAIVAAFAGLRPIGRDALLMRFVVGLTWDEMERVCGVPGSRMRRRTCRAWRRMGEVLSPPVEPLAESAGQDDSEDRWFAAVRHEATRFMPLRTRLRQTYGRVVEPPSDWMTTIWGLVDEQEQQARLRAEQAAEAARKIEEAPMPLEPEPESSQVDSSQGGSAEVDSSEVDSSEVEGEPEASSGSRLWVVLGVAAAVAGAAYWVMGL